NHCWLGAQCMIGREDGSVPGCISAKDGGKFVFLTGGRVFQIGNQDFGDLRVDADHTVQLSGIMIKDTITVSKITMPARYTTDVFSGEGDRDAATATAPPEFIGSPGSPGNNHEPVHDDRVRHDRRDDGRAL